MRLLDLLKDYAVDQLIYMKCSGPDTYTFISLCAVFENDATKITKLHNNNFFKFEPLCSRLL